MSIVKAAILVVGIGAVSPLAAQDRVHLHPWVSVATDPSAGVDLIFTPVITKEGACIEFRNLGSQAIHFGYYFPEWQVANQAAERREAKREKIGFYDEKKKKKAIRYFNKLKRQRKMGKLPPNLKTDEELWDYSIQASGLLE